LVSCLPADVGFVGLDVVVVEAALIFSMLHFLENFLGSVAGIVRLDQNKNSIKCLSNTYSNLPLILC